MRKEFIFRSSNPQNYYCSECNGIHRAISERWKQHQIYIDISQFIKTINKDIINECIKFMEEGVKEYIKNIKRAYNKRVDLLNSAPQLNESFVFFKIDYKGKLKRVIRWDQWGRSFTANNELLESVEKLTSKYREYIEENKFDTLIIMKLVPHQIIKTESKFIKFEIKI